MGCVEYSVYTGAGGMGIWAGGGAVGSAGGGIERSVVLACSLVLKQMQR